MMFTSLKAKQVQISFFYVYPPNPANLKISSLTKFHGQTSVLNKIIKTLYITCILIKLI